MTEDDSLRELDEMRLGGDRVYLRSLAWQDTERILRWRADPVVAGQLFSDRAPTREEHKAWFTMLQQSGDRVEFVIVVREGDLPVGTIGLSHIDQERSEAEYGVLIGEAEWRGIGLAREASELMLRYAFEILNLHRVIIRLFADNAPACALYARLGFVEHPAFRAEREKEGVRWKVMGMVLTREDWQTRR